MNNSLAEVHPELVSEWSEKNGRSKFSLEFEGGR